MFQDGMGAKREQMTFGFYPSPMLVLSPDDRCRMEMRENRPHSGQDEHSIDLDISSERATAVFGQSPVIKQEPARGRLMS
jgi:hypothetical protein